MAAEKSSKQRKAKQVPKERAQFRQLLVSNPNYFGTLEGVAFKPVKAKKADGTYEALTCVGYNPARAQLEATFEQKSSTGYSGGPCSPGSREYVRFYADAGAGWVDAGVSGVKVTDLPADQDCAGADIHPLSHTVTVGYSPRRLPCTTPQLVRVRAILSWNLEPPADTPGYLPVWGSVHECTVQVAPSRRLRLTDLVDKGTLLEVLELPEPLIPIIEQPIPVPQPPVPPLPLLARRYAKQRKVPASRFAYAAAVSVTAQPGVTAAAVNEAAQLFDSVNLNLGEILAEIGKTSGSVTYEQLECVGLDNNLERLVGTFRVKLPNGYSGPLCESGSKEYVAFWADWDDACEWTYLGTAEVSAYDLGELPDGGVCYSAVLPVDLDPLRRACDEPRVARIRAVLSWNVAPSTSDPDALPVWGNRVDVHARVLPGVPGDIDNPSTWITLIGGVNVTTDAATSGIHPVTGLTTDTAVAADLGVMAGAGRPFGGWIVVRGPSFTGRYRLLKRPVGGTWTPMTASFRLIKEDGTLGTLATPDVDGWVHYTNSAQNFTRLLGNFRPAGDEQWEIKLEQESSGAFSPSYLVQLDNTSPTVDIGISSPGGTCGKFPSGTEIEGSFTVDDLYLRSWTIRVLNPDPDNIAAIPAVSPPSGSTSQTPGTWKFDTSGLPPCGYNVVLHAQDRTIVNSQHHSANDAQTQAGFCLDAPG